MLNEFGTYTGALDTTRNDLIPKPSDKNNCPNGTDISRPPNLSVPAATTWNYPYLGNFYNYYANNSYDSNDVNQYDNQKCGSQFSRNYSQHPAIQSASVLQCCDPRCQLLSEHSKYPFNQSLNNKLNQRLKRSKNYYNGIIDLPKAGPEPLPKPSEHITKYSHCSVPPYPSLQNDLNGKYHNQQTDYGAQYHSTIKSSKHVLLPDSTAFGDYYTDIGKPSYWNKQNIWHRNVPTSYYPSPSFEQDKGINQKIPSNPVIHEQNIAAAVNNQRGILFNRLLDHRECTYDNSYMSNYYYDKQSQLSKSIGEYSSQSYLNRDHRLYNDVTNNTRLPLQSNNNSYHHHSLPMYNLHYPHESVPLTSCKEPSSMSVSVPVPVTSSSTSSSLTLAKELQQKNNLEEKSRISEKNPNLDVREFLSTWDDDVEDDKLPDNNASEAPVIVLDCSSLDGEVLAKVKEKLGENISDCPLNNNSCEQYDSMNNATVLKIIENGNENTVLSPHTSVIQDTGNTIAARAHTELTEKINELKNDSCHLKKSPSESSHLNSDGFLTWYSNTKKKDNLSCNLVEMTERLVNTVDKLFNEPEKKTNLKPVECSFDNPYDTRNMMMSTEVSLAKDINEKNSLSENEWNINFNYKKSKNVMTEKLLPSSIPANAIQRLSSDSQLPEQHQPNYNQFTHNEPKENAFSNPVEVVAPPFKNCSSTIPYTDETKNHPPSSSQCMTNEKNVSCSFNLQKTSNDFKFSVNYSKQATEYNMSKVQDFSIKYKNADNYPQYDYNKYKTTLSSSMSTPVMTTTTAAVTNHSNEFYKNYPIYNNSCCFANESCDYNNLLSNSTTNPTSSKECDSMNYVEHMEKDMSAANDTDITLVKADLEKSLKEITHQFSYQKQNITNEQTEDTNPVGDRFHISNLKLNFHETTNYVNNKNELRNENNSINETNDFNGDKTISAIDIDKTASNIAFAEKVSDQSPSYNSVIQKTGTCSTKLYKNEKQQDEDCTQACENSLLSMPSLSPPSSPKITSTNLSSNKDAKSKSPICGVNLTLNDVYENDVIFDTEETTNINKHENDGPKGVIFDENITNAENSLGDSTYQPLNLALSKHTKDCNISLPNTNQSLAIDDRCWPVENEAKENQQLNTSDNMFYETNSRSDISDIDKSNMNITCDYSSTICTNSSMKYVEDKFLDSHTSKADDGYYSAENKTDSCDVDVDVGGVKKNDSEKTEQKTPSQTILSYQTCIVSRTHYENSLEKEEVINNETRVFIKDKKTNSETWPKTFPCAQDLSINSIMNNKELCVPNALKHHNENKVLAEYKEVNCTNEYNEESLVCGSARCENLSIRKPVNESVLMSIVNREKNLDDCEPVVDIKKNLNNGASAVLIDNSENVDGPGEHVNISRTPLLPLPSSSKEIRKIFDNDVDNIDVLENIPDSNTIRAITKTYEKLSEYETDNYEEAASLSIKQNKSNVDTVQYEKECITEKYKHKHKKIKLKKTNVCERNSANSDHASRKNESALNLKKADVLQSINSDDGGTCINYLTNSVIKKNGNYVLRRESSTSEDDGRLNDNKNVIDPYTVDSKNIGCYVTSQCTSPYKYGEQHEKCSMETESAQESSAKSSLMNKESHETENDNSISTANPLCETVLYDSDDIKIDNKEDLPQNGDTYKCVQIQNLNSTDCEYMKFKKRKLISSSMLSVKDADLPMKKRKQEFERATSPVDIDNFMSYKILNDSSENCKNDVKAENDFRANLNIENERYFLNGASNCANRGDESIDNKNTSMHPLSKEYSSRIKKYKRKRKKEKAKSKSSKKKYKKLKRRFSLSEKSCYEWNKNSTELCRTYPKYFKRSKSLNHFPFNEISTDENCKFEMDDRNRIKLHNGLFSNSHLNSSISSKFSKYYLKSIKETVSNDEVNAEWPIREDIDVPNNCFYQNNKFDDEENCRKTSDYTKHINISNDSEQDDSDFTRNIIVDDEIFNIPSIAPTPNCDLIRDDNVDLEDRRTPDSPCEFENKETTTSAFTYSAPTPNCILKIDECDNVVENDDEICSQVSILDKRSPYSVESCASLEDDDVDVLLHSSKAPSPNCILTEETYTNEKELIIPSSTCCVDKSPFFRIDDEHTKSIVEEDSHDSNFSSVAPSPNCNIIEGVLLDDSDYSKTCNEFEFNHHEKCSVMSDDENESEIAQQIPSLRSLAINVLSKMKINSSSNDDNSQNMLEVWVTSEKTEIIIQAEEQESTDVVFSNGDASNLVITEAAAITYDDEINILTNYEKEKEISFEYATTNVETSMNAFETEKNDDDLQCQCLIISSEESILCLRCSLNSSVIVNHENNYDISVNELESNTVHNSNTSFSNECIEESFIDQKISFTPDWNEDYEDKKFDEILSPLRDIQGCNKFFEGNDIATIKPTNLNKNYQIKVKLPWHKIFNLRDENAVTCDERKILELGPAQIEVRLSPDDSGLWKVVNSNNGNASPVVKVKRLVLQRAAKIDDQKIKNRKTDEEEKLSSNVLVGTSNESNEVQQSVNNRKIEILRLPKMVIRKTSCQEYKSFLRVNNIFQPVVRLFKSKSLDEMALKFCKENNDVTVNLKEVGKSLIEECDSNFLNYEVEKTDDITEIDRFDDEPSDSECNIDVRICEVRSLKN